MNPLETIRRPAYIVYPVILILVTLVAPPPAHAQVNAPRQVIAPGGRSTSTNYRLYSFVAEAGVGRATGVSGDSLGVTLGYGLTVLDFLLDSSVAVAIAHFGAVVDGYDVRLSWIVGYDDELQKITIYRSQSETGPFLPISPQNVAPEASGSYVDTNVSGGQTYWYRLGAIDSDGEFFSPIVAVTSPTWPTRLEQNSPNPFNPVTNISFFLSRPARTKLIVYDVNGRRVRTLVDERRDRGRHAVTWDGWNDNGQQVSTGVYFYQLRAGTDVQTKKMMLLK